VEAAEDERKHQADLSDIDRQIASKQMQLGTARQELERQSRVTSPCSGRVIEITALVGDVVSGQQPMLLVEQDTAKANDLTAVLLVPPEDGKKVRLGMAALVNPSTVRATEYGGIKAVVTGVSDHPVSSRFVSRLLANPDLGRSLAASGSQFQITVSMVADTGTFSGFQWTSGTGPQVAIGSGTPCGGEIILEEVPPVSYVVPFFRKVILGESDELPAKPR
jgi:HlyD family secretion protein